MGHAATGKRILPYGPQRPSTAGAPAPAAGPSRAAAAGGARRDRLCQGRRDSGVPAGGAWLSRGLSEPSALRSGQSGFGAAPPGPGAASPGPERTAVPRAHEEQTRENPRLSDGGPRQTRCVRAPRAPPAPARERPRPGEREQGPSRRTRGREWRRESPRRPAPPHPPPRGRADQARPGLAQPYRSARGAEPASPLAVAPAGFEWGEPGAPRLARAPRAWGHVRRDAGREPEVPLTP
ncbi:uncharacterized protein LOC134425005 [Melospiza melodia melodia]|uniref:uncharacterized protein LOC134425005 n=1 Tax=Melospiza melodia melodia TaxID=1914991 RepID=UPI002FD5FF84